MNADDAEMLRDLTRSLFARAEGPGEPNPKKPAADQGDDAVRQLARAMFGHKPADENN